MADERLTGALLHPVRWRIVRAFFGRDLTTSQLREIIDDVPVTSLYRHVATLADAGVLTVVGERQVRGTIERTYSLAKGKDHLGDAEASAMSRDEHRMAFQMLLARMGADFDAYLARDHIDVVADQVNYSQVAIYVTEEDWPRIQQGFIDLFGPYLTAPDDPDDERYRRMVLTTVLLPDPSPDR
ncbi:helix-turn-helix domain-containing protein [Actinomadura viridis]|uniref:DNA-binding transcriptional ArsR family regulator n=1 Tax=Actinomadura viridis TaxID=58110 RepID=A0A931GL72_9ACTN|nr:helix-turn-helix domain-containing protein [Actinomadura viridis]MBG6091713.1 DNA-binding transcriptional ArsR family regulator [Actinomadura viridis]